MQKELEDWHRQLCKVTSEISIALARRALRPDHKMEWPRVLNKVAKEIEQHASTNNVSSSRGQRGDGDGPVKGRATGTRKRASAKKPNRKPMADI